MWYIAIFAYVITVIIKTATGLSYETILDGTTGAVKKYTDQSACREFARQMDLVNSQTSMWGKQWIAADCHEESAAPAKYELWAWWKPEADGTKAFPEKYLVGRYPSYTACTKAKRSDPLIRLWRCNDMSKY